ncbi:hypothetical protein L3X38_013502 [Prunus dulcis]|uniref:Uncharacterized protein n=1 Tax=Prunus dulcis TaxID=3755 RepID=A0AAD4ZH22_PRUDU|nr:hypothetical protein L3X38_013502 [Prunus dulcis]
MVFILWMYCVLVIFSSNQSHCALKKEGNLALNRNEREKDGATGVLGWLSRRLGFVWRVVASVWGGKVLAVVVEHVVAFDDFGVVDIVEDFDLAADLVVEPVPCRRCLRFRSKSKTVTHLLTSEKQRIDKVMGLGYQGLT